MTFGLQGIGQEAGCDWPYCVDRTDLGEQRLGVAGGCYRAPHSKTEVTVTLRSVSLCRNLSELDFYLKMAHPFVAASMWPQALVSLPLSSPLSEPTQASPTSRSGGGWGAGRLPNQPTHHLWVISDSMLPFCQIGFSGERYSCLPHLTVCDTIALILAPPCPWAAFRQVARQIPFFPE